MSQDYVGNRLEVGDFVYFIGAGKASAHGKYERCICQLTRLDKGEYPRADVYVYGWNMKKMKHEFVKLLSDHPIKVETKVKLHVDKDIRQKIMKADANWEKNL